MSGLLFGELAIEAAAEAAQDAYLDALDAAEVARVAARRARRVASKARPLAAATMWRSGVGVADIAARLGCSATWARELVRRGEVLISDAADADAADAE